MKWQLSVNPVLARESRVRMRGWKAPALICLYVGAMGLAVWAFIAITRRTGGTFAPELGGIIFMFLAMMQLGLIGFSAPGLTAAAISGERERQTLDLLLVTNMSPLQVVIGKLGAAVGFTVLLMIASLPVYSILFLLGGISLYHLLLTAVVYVVTVVLLGAIGVYFSALFKRTQAAIVASYGVTLLISGGAFILSILAQEVFFRRVVGGMMTNDMPLWTVGLAIINPITGLASAVGGPMNDIFTLWRPHLVTTASRGAIWWLYCLWALGATAVLCWLTARRIQPLKNK